MLASNFNLLGMVNNVRKSFQRESCFLEVLPQGGQPQQGSGYIARKDPEGNQLAKGEFALEHQPRPHPKHQQA